ncbi:MAG: serine hydrolase [Candidatus Saccharimonadales bacterium]
MGKKLAIIQSYVSVLAFWNRRMQPNSIPETRTSPYGENTPDFHREWPTEEFYTAKKPWWFLPKVFNAIYSHKKITYFSYPHSESLLASYKGKLIHEWYADGFNDKTEFPMMSMTKTITSIILGIAIKEGYVKSIKQSILDFYPEAKQYIKVDDSKNKLTIEHLITMTSGLKDDSEWRLAADTGLAGLLRKQSNPPGKKFKYISVNYHVLACALQRVLKRDLYDFAKERIFDPLGITSVKWNKLSDGSRQANGGMTMTARDMLRLGNLWLNNGRWEDKQIVPVDYIKQQTPRSKALYAFGSPFWNNTWFPFSFMGSFESRGHNGQFISVYPNGLVVVRNGWPAKRRSIQDKSKKLSGTTFVLPGLLLKKPSKKEAKKILEAKRIIEGAGGIITKNVNPKTSFVVTEDNKLQEAIKHRDISKKRLAGLNCPIDELKLIIKSDLLEIPIINYEKLKSMI